LARLRGRKGAAGGTRERDALLIALRAVLDDDLGEAEDALAALVRDDSDQVDAYLALARIYRRRGEIGRAIRIHQNLLLRRDLADEHRDDALEGLARDFQRGGFLQRAIAAYQEVLQRKPKDPKALRALMRLSADARDFDSALAAQKRLARVEPAGAKDDEARLLVEMAQAAHAAGQTDGARKALKKAVSREPSLAVAWMRLGEIEAERGKNKAALAAWKRLVETDRRAGAEVYARLETAYAALGKPRDFETLLRRLLEERSGDTAARLALIRHLAARGDVDAALIEAKAALESDPQHVALHGARARALLSEGHEAEALEALHELLEVLDRHGLLEHRERLD
jgi:lipopolysaccharide biosynthesis regulator YciM